MNIQVFDVSHGFCAYLIADNGNVMLFDCGHNENTGFRPSDYLPFHGCTAIESFFITNFDHDHVSDLANLREVLHIGILYRNRTIPPEALRELKEAGGPLSEGLEAALDMVTEYSEDAPVLPAYPDVELATFHNSYPVFEDTNNLSLVVFIHYDGLGIVFPGDLEELGWRALLKNPNFREHLKRVNLFVASHHGRRSGYCEDVFSYCRPEVVLISDEAIRYDDYKRHARGVPWNGTTARRLVLTTRSDGMIRITKTLGEQCAISVGDDG
ncbi:MAG: MBL fold metallo-hydrolase [candidate division Zixibacteria bacterium]|nr:MBL fold metallo-hydrolase [candidate division Zixibacteria bacterium]